MRRKRRRALQLADRPRLRQRQISWAKNEGAQTGARSLRASVERPGGEDDPKKTRVIESAGKLAVNWASARVSRLRLAYISSVFFNCQINYVTFYSTRNATKKGDTSNVFFLFLFLFSLAIFRHFSTKKLGIFFWGGFSSVISTIFSLFFGIKFRQIFYSQKMKTPLPLGSPAPPKKKIEGLSSSTWIKPIWIKCH
jgi:hypothetical protein